MSGIVTSIVISLAIFGVICLCLSASAAYSVVSERRLKRIRLEKAEKEFAETAPKDRAMNALADIRKEIARVENALSAHEAVEMHVMRALYVADNPHVIWDGVSGRFTDDSDEIHFRLWRDAA